MKYLFTIAILLSLQTSNFAVENYNQGDALYVWAPSGLNMRAEANTSGAKITKIPYAEQVIIVDTKLFAHPFSYTMARGVSYAGKEINWMVSGYWVKVEYKGAQGYVFDAYLGKYPAFSVQDEKKGPVDFAMVKDYGRLYWGGFAEEIKTTKLDYEAFNRDPDKGRSTSEKLIFNNGSYLEDWDESFLGGNNIFLKGASLTEGYHFFNILISYEQGNKQAIEEDEKDQILLNEVKEDGLFFHKEMSEYSIKKVEGGVLIELSGGC